MCSTVRKANFVTYNNICMIKVDKISIAIKFLWVSKQRNKLHSRCSKLLKRTHFSTLKSRTVAQRYFATPNCNTVYYHWRLVVCLDPLGWARGCGQLSIIVHGGNQGSAALVGLIGPGLAVSTIKLPTQRISSAWLETPLTLRHICIYIIQML